jgi:hypothetical protein
MSTRGEAGLLRFDFVIASEAKQSRIFTRRWIASLRSQ